MAEIGNMPIAREILENGVKDMVGIGGAITREGPRRGRGAP